jgi:hypothetical protein
MKVKVVEDDEELEDCEGEDIENMETAETVRKKEGVIKTKEGPD